MKYDRLVLKRKSKKELIDIIIKLQNPTIITKSLLEPYTKVIADGTQGMRRG